jgi:hypothetical protein
MEIPAVRAVIPSEARDLLNPPGTWPVSGYAAKVPRFARDDEPYRDELTSP